MDVTIYVCFVMYLYSSTLQIIVMVVADLDNELHMTCIMLVVVRQIVHMCY